MTTNAPEDQPTKPDTPEDALERARQHIASTLTAQTGFYRPTDPAIAAAAYVDGLKLHVSDDPAFTHQVQATAQLAGLITRGHKLGLPPLHWSLGSGRNLSGYLVGASLPQPNTEEDRVRGFLAWCAVLDVTAVRHDGKEGYADRWHSDEAVLTPDVSVFLRYARDWFSEPCSVCSGNLPADEEENVR